MTSSPVLLYRRDEGTLRLPTAADSDAPGREITVQEIVIESGRLTTIEGKSGSGKSFLLAVLCGNHDDSRLDDEGRSQAARYTEEPSGKTGDFGALSDFVYIPQNPELRKELTVEEEAWRTWRSLGVAPEEGRNPLQWMGLGALAGRKVGSLSGGELKRFGIALRLCRPAKCIVLDEPEAGLDRRSFEELCAFLRAIPQVPAPALVMVTHHGDWCRGDHRTEVTSETRTGSTVIPLEPHRFLGADIPRRVFGRTWHQVTLMWRGWADLVVFFSPTVLIAALITLASPMSAKDPDAEPRFKTQAFFLVIAGAWLGLQFASREVFHSIASWREDVRWLTRLLQARSALAEAVILGCSLLLTAVAAGVLFGVGLSLTFVLLNSGLFPDRLAGFLPLTVGAVASAVHGAALGGAIAAALSAISMHRWPVLSKVRLTTSKQYEFGTRLGWTARRVPNPIWLTMVIPMVMLVHIVLSPIFLRGKGFVESHFMDETTLVAALSRGLPTTWSAAVAESSRELAGSQGALQPLHYLSDLMQSMVLSVIPCVWITCVALYSCFQAPEIRER